MCDALKNAHCRFETRLLPESLHDYFLVRRVDGVDYALPQLIERKSPKDVAASLRDGPSFAYSPSAYSAHARRDRVASLPPWRSYHGMARPHKGPRHLIRACA